MAHHGKGSVSVPPPQAGRCLARILKEIAQFRKAPPPNAPRLFVRDDDVHTIYALMLGVTGTPYEGGQYVVCFHLPSDYPFAPPDIVFLTPNGRFEVGKRICTTFTSYHAEEWSPSNTLTSLMISLISFMCDDLPGVGGVVDTPAGRRALALDSARFNEQNAKTAGLFPPEAEASASG